MLVVIGSSALRFRLNRPVNDIDLLGPYDEIVAWMRDHGGDYIMPFNHGKKLFTRIDDDVAVEAEIAWMGSTTDKIYHLIIDDPKTIQYDGLLVPSIDFLYMLKMSHRYLRNSPHFLKTMRDIQTLRLLGAEVDPRYEQIMAVREEETYNYSHPKLNTSKVEFFNPSVEYKYDHDSIHKVMAQASRPAYEYFKVDGEEVMCSRSKFMALDEVTKLNAVLEEALVLALERSQIPYDFQVDSTKSFTMALEKICTSITSGWFREFAWEHYDEVMKLFHRLENEYRYVDKFLDNLDSGTIRLHKQDSTQEIDK